MVRSRTVNRSMAIGMEAVKLLELYWPGSIDNSSGEIPLPMQHGIGPPVPKKIESFSQTGAIVLPSALEVSTMVAGGNLCQDSSLSC
jgi:hypothetical protein